MVIMEAGRFSVGLGVIMSRRTKVSQNGPSEISQCDKLKKRKELFIQQFEKEAEERTNEMESKLEKLLATLDRTIKIEMMKLPQSLHTTLIKDLMSKQETSVGEVTMAIAATSPEISRPLSREPSRKAKSSTDKVSSGALQKSNSQIKMDDGSKKRPKKKMQSSNSTGSLRCASTISGKRTQGRVLKLSDQVLLPGAKMRGNHRALSDDFSGFATATITTSHGETLFLSEDNKDEVRLELLDDLALCQMQKIKELMDYLCNKVRMNNTQ